MLPLFCGDSFSEYRVFSRSGRSLALPRRCSPKCVPQHVYRGASYKKSGGQTRTQDLEVSIVDNAQMYLSIRASFSKTVSGIKELLLCAFEGSYGAEIFISDGQDQYLLGMMVLTPVLKARVVQHPCKLNDEPSRWGWGRLGIRHVPV